MFTDKITLAIAESAKKCIDEELKGKQHKIDANKNGKVDAQDFKLLRKQKGVSEEAEQMDESAAGLKRVEIDKSEYDKLKQQHADQKAKNPNGKHANTSYVHTDKSGNTVHQTWSHPDHNLTSIDHTPKTDKYHKFVKEETVNEEEGKYGYVAFSHDGKRHELYANTSYEAKQKAVKHFNPPKSKQHLVTVHLAKKDGKDVVHTATESVQEGAVPSTEKTVKLKHKTSGKEIVVTAKSANDYKSKGYEHVNESAIDDLRDRQAAKREANPYGSTDKKEPTVRKVQGSQYGGSKQKHEPEKELDEAKMSDEDMAQREKIVKGMKKNLKGFKARYGERAKDVMYATATKQAMKEEVKKKPVVVQTSKEVGSRVSEIGPGGKEYNVKTDSAWDKKSVKEDVEQLDEISKKTLGSYVKKAAYNAQIHTMAMKDIEHEKGGYTTDSLRHDLKRTNRRAGIVKAVNRLTKEEVTNDGFKAELEDNKAKAAGTKKQADVHKASVQSVKQESFSEKLSMLKEGVRSFLKGRNDE